MSLHLYVGSTQIPGFFSVALLFLYIFLFEKTLPQEYLVPCLTLLIVPAFSLYGNDLSYFSNRMLGFLALTYSLAAAFAFFFVCKQADAGKLRKILHGVILFLLIVVLVERLTSIDTFFSSVRSFIYSGRGIYDAGERDVSMVGFVRPMFIFSEPSHLSQAIGTLILFASILSPKTLLNVAMYLSALAVSYMLIGSPTTVLYLLCIGYVSRSAFRRGHLPILLFAPLITCLFLMLTTGISIPGLARFERILEGKDSSQALRLLIPLEVTKQVIYEYPLLGVGISGSEIAREQFDKGFRKYGRSLSLYKDSWHRSIHSALLNIFISFGLIGGVVFLFSIFMVFSKLTNFETAIDTYVLISLIQLSIGDIVTPRLWFLSFGLLAFISITATLDQKTQPSHRA